MECDLEGKSILSLLKKASQESIQRSADASLDAARCQGRFLVSVGGAAHLRMALAYDDNTKWLYERSASCMMWDVSCKCCPGCIACRTRCVGSLACVVACAEVSESITVGVDLEDKQT